MRAALLCFLACASSAGAQATGGNQRPRVLLVTGSGVHDWQVSSEAARAALENSTRFEVVVTTAPERMLADRLELARYAAVVLDSVGEPWPAQASEALLDAVRGGLGAVVLHGALGPLAGWHGTAELVGPCEQTREATTADVRIVERTHPVSRGLTAFGGYEDHLELVLAPADGRDVLVRIGAEGGALVQAGALGDGRVLVSALGHAGRGSEDERLALNDASLARLLVRATEWASLGDVTEEPSIPHALSDWEQRAGWRLLFDGTTTHGLRAEGWRPVGNTLERFTGGAPLVTDATFTNFELVLEWSGADGEWWTARAARFDGALVEGGALLEVEADAGPLVLLANAHNVTRVRGLRVRDLRPRGERVSLFDGNTLDGWRVIGGATYRVEHGELIGEARDLARNSFLATEREFGDFVLELELKNDVPCNSGIQVRSHAGDDGVVRGYQFEVDPSERAWSGGLYDESRRGWLYDLSHDPAARAAFRPGEWNHYRIECIGPTLRSWVNGIPVTRFADGVDALGFIALQVHSGPEARMRWRELSMWEL